MGDDISVGLVVLAFAVQPSASGVLVGNKSTWRSRREKSLLFLHRDLPAGGSLTDDEVGQPRRHVARPFSGTIIWPGMSPTKQTQPTPKQGQRITIFLRFTSCLKEIPFLKQKCTI
jgi:hypothetical protein